jgi:ferredoxin-nitrite reductase
MSDFSNDQKRYLEGFAAGAQLAKRTSTFAATLGGGGGDASGSPDRLCHEAQDATTRAGKKLCNEEQAKRKRFPLDVFPEIRAHAARNEPPKGLDVLAFKYFGLFWVAPAQDSFMSRLRFAGGIVPSYQLRGVADLAAAFGGAYADVTTRANLQVRQIAPKDADQFLEGLYDLGIVNRGAGGDNIRNVTASPLAGIDPDELIDTRKLARDLHHLILNKREMFGLPRKFNIAFDGGGRISALEDTNDIGFSALRRKSDGQVHFRLTLGGITGHKDFARDTGIALLPDDCIPVAEAIVRAFIRLGDRTDRKKARLKYVLDRMGFDGFVAEVEKELGRAMPRIALDDFEPRPAIGKHAHVGVHRQSQAGLNYIGMMLPVGRMTSEQMRRLADLCERRGSRHVRLTVWQNVILPDVADADVDAVVKEIESIGFSTTWSPVRAGLVACTGAAGCKFGNADTKRNALQLADHLEQHVPQLDQPINVHLTGCPHSCAQHFIGDIGLLATKVGEEAREGYHLFVGGGYGVDQRIGVELARNVLADDVARVVQALVEAYLARRASAEEAFQSFSLRHTPEQLRAMLPTQQEAIAP